MTDAVVTRPRRDARVRPAPTVGMTKSEVFAACQALADANGLLRAGHLVEAGAQLFELLEARLFAVDQLGVGS